MHMPTRAARVRQRVAQRMPAGLMRRYRVWREGRALRRIPALPCDAATLRPRNGVDRDRLLRPADGDDLWARVWARLEPLGIPERRGGLNIGDRRGLVHLARGLGARSVLEIGTHIGASTVSLAAALADTGEAGVRLVSVDIADVNSAESRPWLTHGARSSPAAMVRALGCDGFVEFVTAPSLDHLAHCTERFDLIVLDGDHAAAMVYREIPAALPLLEEGGVIVLHDWFPGLQPIWPDVPVLPGPFLATERLAGEGAPLEVVPLGPLPWTTAERSDGTSLALLLRRLV